MSPRATVPSDFLPYGGLSIRIYFNHRSRILSIPVWSRSLSAEATDCTSEESEEKGIFSFNDPCGDLELGCPCCRMGRAGKDLGLLPGAKFLSSQFGGLNNRVTDRSLESDISASFELGRTAVRKSCSVRASKRAGDLGGFLATKMPFHLRGDRSQETLDGVLSLSSFTTVTTDLRSRSVGHGTAMCIGLDDKVGVVALLLR